jgi:K+-sensing histidine kinase KdpD
LKARLSQWIDSGLPSSESNRVKKNVQERYRGNLLRAISHDLRTRFPASWVHRKLLMDMTQKDDPRYTLAEGIYKDADCCTPLSKIF